MNFRVTGKQQNSITVAWQAPASSQQNGIITNYTVHIITKNGSSYSQVATGLYLTGSSLLSNSMYFFSVAASTVAGRGPYTSPASSVKTLFPGSGLTVAIFFYAILYIVSLQTQQVHRKMLALQFWTMKEFLSLGKHLQNHSRVDTLLDTLLELNSHH